MFKFTQYSCEHKNSKNICISLAPVIIEVTKFDTRFEYRQN